MGKNPILIFFAIINLSWSFDDQYDRLILPKLQHSDPNCFVDALDYLEIENYHKFVVYLNLDDSQTKVDFGKWVGLSNAISNQLTSKAIFYMHSGECDPQWFTKLETVSNEHGILILFDHKNEFLGANSLRKARTISALVDYKNDIIYSSKSGYTFGLKDQYISEVKQLLDFELPYVDPIPEVVKKDFSVL